MSKFYSKLKYLDPKGRNIFQNLTVENFSTKNEIKATLISCLVFAFEHKVQILIFILIVIVIIWPLVFLPFY